MLLFLDLNQGGSLVLGLKSALGTLDGSISHIPSADLPFFPTVIPSSGAGTSTAREADGSPVDNTNASLDGFIMEDYLNDEDLEEEQLDFSCFEEEYERWRDLFSSNQNTTSCPKLIHFSALNDIKSCPFLAKDLDHSCDDWKLCHWLCFG
ncbi:hypothetical protein NC651_021250 [Populus alba x Populus x berolinensis]|nr:hypothetical protein NC651_021250 [Populus alba x Populus x berolinensis]